MTLQYKLFFIRKIVQLLIKIQRWILSRAFKRDTNNDYGIYPENGDYVVNEVVDQNTNYEQHPAAIEDQTRGRQVSVVSENETEYDGMYEAQANDRENTYDNMYEGQVDERENTYDNMNEGQVAERENTYDKMYD